MVRFYALGQLGLTLIVFAIVVERARELFFRAPTSERALRWLGTQLKKGDAAGPLSWANRLPDTYVSQVLRAQLGTEDRDFFESSDLIRVELRYAVGRRLGLLRSSATLSSVLGLLGAILAIRQGFNDTSLLALQAGLAQKVAVAQALESMGIGVGTSAFCFYALGLFRRVARDLIRQATHIAHILSQHAVDAQLRAKGPSQ